MLEHETRLAGGLTAESGNRKYRLVLIQHSGKVPVSTHFLPLPGKDEFLKLFCYSLRRPRACCNTHSPLEISDRQRTPVHPADFIRGALQNTLR